MAADWGTRLLVPIARLLAVVMLGVAALGPAHAAPASRIVAFGDVHGGAAQLRALLNALNVTGAQNDWIGGATRLVSLGDLLDRGPDSRDVLELLMKLEQQAPRAGGSVHVVLGNHEVMNLTGDLRYVSDEEFEAFAADEDPAIRAQARAAFEAIAGPAAEAADPEAEAAAAAARDLDAEFERRYPPGFFGHRAAFAPDGRYGRWLLSKPQVLVLDDIAFVHGGLSGHFETEAVADFNARVAGEIAGLLRIGASLVADGVLPPWQDLLTAEPTDPEATLPRELVEYRESFSFGTTSPTWYRGTAACHALIEAPRFERVLRARGLERIVMGHTPTNPRIIQTRFDGRAILADTGMYAPYYHGNPSALVFERGDMKTFTLDRDGTLTPRLGHPAVDVRAGPETELQTALAGTLAAMERVPSAEPFTLEAAGRTYEGRLHRSRRDRNAILAAQALDKLLGLGLVAPVSALGPDARNGAVEVLPQRSITETDRISGGVQRPNWCAGTSDYQLMYAFDYLIGNEARGPDTLHYDRTTWLLWLTGHDRAFGTSTRMPPYLENTSVALPVALAERLAALDADGLERALGQFLGDRQIRALLERRDGMLASWPAKE